MLKQDNEHTKIAQATALERYHRGSPLRQLCGEKNAAGWLPAAAGAAKSLMGVAGNPQTWGALGKGVMGTGKKMLGNLGSAFTQGGNIANVGGALGKGSQMFARGGQALTGAMANNPWATAGIAGAGAGLAGMAMGGPQQHQQQPQQGGMMGGMFGGMLGGGQQQPRQQQGRMW